MEKKIGEIFKLGGEWFQCVEGNCAYCSIQYEVCGQRILNDVCKPNRIFKKLEKVGEPYYNYEKKLCQQYKCYTKPLVADVIVYIFAENNIVVIEIKQNKEDMEDLDKIKVRDSTKVEELNVMEENKLNLKPFDIQKAREGKPVCTRDGRSVRILCFDANIMPGNKNILALIRKNDGSEYVEYYTSNGKFSDSKDDINDLMMLLEKKSGWIKVKKNVNLYDTKEEADRKMIGNTDYVSAKVCWEEQYGMGSSR